MIESGDEFAVDVNQEEIIKVSKSIPMLGKSRLESFSFHDEIVICVTYERISTFLASGDKRVSRFD